MILLIIATAILIAWLLVSVTRFALSDLRLPGLRPSPAQPVGAPADVASESPAIVAQPKSVGAESEPYDDLEAERVVRERLYGRRERRA